jgi:uncharacterized protein YigE (DUF2233 family)
MLRRCLILSLLVAGLATAGETTAEPAIILREVSGVTGGRGLRLSLLIFSARDFRLRVIDNASPSGTARFPRLADAMTSLGALAGCNGGFFNRNPFEPVGLMVSDGKRVGPLDPESWMKGLLVVRNSVPSLETTASFLDEPHVTDAIQSGPWLVRSGLSETDNSRRQVAVRTFICHDARGTWAIGSSEVCTLAELAAALKSPRVTAVLDIQFALNLDGGPSTGLWLRQPTGNFHLPDRWPDRNYLGLFPRTVP